MLTPSIRTRATITAADTVTDPGVSSTKKSADSEEDTELQEAIRTSMMEAPTVPSTSASKRTNSSR